MAIRVIALAVLAAAVAAAPAYGKGDVTATMVTPIPADAEPGSEVRVVWRLRIDVEGRSHPVNADGVYLRLVGADGSRQDAYARPGAHEDGIYAATVRIPAGGVERAVVGIRGNAQYEDGRSVSRDAYFPLASDAVAAESSGLGRGALLLGLGLVVLATLAVVVARRRRRPQGMGASASAAAISSARSRATSVT
jgi:hypothetical protein